ISFHWACSGLYPDASVADPTSGGATAHGESEDHHSRGDDCDRDPEDGSTKNSLHDGRPCLESGQSGRIPVSPINPGASRDWFAIRPTGVHGSPRGSSEPRCPAP